MIHVVAIITAKSGMREAILKAFHANMPAVHAEKAASNTVRRSTPRASAASRPNSDLTPLS
jgi:hypothetical protein